MNYTDDTKEWHDMRDEFADSVDAVQASLRDWSLCLEAFHEMSKNGRWKNNAERRTMIVSVAEEFRSVARSSRRLARIATKARNRIIEGMQDGE